MTPFQITAQVLTPFHMRFPVTLDALLAEAMNNKTGLGRETAYEQLPLARRDGIYQASSLQIIGRPEVTRMSRIMVLRGPRDQSIRAFKPNGRAGKQYSPIDTQRGAYKANMDSYEAISCQAVRWYAVGDPDACVELLRHYLIGIGKRASGGAGELGEISYQLIDEDHSWVNAQGLPARPLAHEHWLSIGGKPDVPVAPMAVTFPYFSSEKVAAVFPSLIR